MRVCVRVYVSEWYLCVCMCVCERERERDRHTDRQRERVYSPPYESLITISFMYFYKKFIIYIYIYIDNKVIQVEGEIY